MPDDLTQLLLSAPDHNRVQLQAMFPPPVAPPEAGKIGPGQPTAVDQATDMLIGAAGVPQVTQAAQAVKSASMGDVGGAVGQAGLLGLALAPMMMGIKSPVGGDMASAIERQGVRAYHGSPNTDLSVIQANPAARQFDNATSQLGAFFSPTTGGARRYAGEGGRIYPANLDLKNPYSMSYRDFRYFQSPEKTALGESVPPGQWGERAHELRTEAQQLRDTLASLGHDSVIITHPRTGEPMEIVSLNDVVPRQSAIGYHASPSDFNKFDITRAGSSTDPGLLGKGLYFSTDPAVAASGPHRYEVELNAANPLKLQAAPDLTKSDVIGAALGIQPPQAGVLSVGKQSPNLPLWQKWAEDVSNKAKARGHDAAVFDYSPAGYKQQEIAVFDPQLIDILRKYGIAGPVAAGTGMAAGYDR